MNNIEKIKPTGIFTNYIFKAIPLAFDESMSYYETLCGILALLKTQIEVINNNADVIIELEDFVNNYFNNLDIQEEINNKLDEMAQDGTLEEIISQYIELKSLLCYDNVNSMKNATNIVEGSYLKTLGYYNKNDGGNAIYKARQITNEDVVDDALLIALNDENLVAEFISFNNNIYAKQFGCIGDGKTDDTINLQKFFNCNIKNHILNNVTYLIDGDLTINSNTDIIGNNATILRKPTELTGYNMLLLQNVENINIKDLNIVGDKNDHLGEDGEWGYGITIWESKNINIDNCNIYDTWGDGIYVGLKYFVTPTEETKNIKINNCLIDGVSRNGITLGSGKNIYINNCIIKNITRTFPKSAIDIEPEHTTLSNTYLEDIHISNIKSIGNRYGIKYDINNNIEGEIFTNNVEIYDCAQAFTFNVEGNTTIELNNIYVKDFNQYVYDIIKIVNTSYVSIYNTIIEDKTSDSNSYYPIIFDNTSKNINNLKIENLTASTKSNRWTYLINATKSGSDYTYSNIILKNINGSGIIKLENFDKDCNIDINNTLSTSYYDYDLNESNYIKNLIFVSASSNSKITVNKNLPNGFYKVILLNRNTYTFRLDFTSFDTVYDNGLTQSNKVYVSNDATARGGIIEFYVNGDNVNIINKVGVWVTAQS